MFVEGENVKITRFLSSIKNVVNHALTPLRLSLSGFNQGKLNATSKIIGIIRSALTFLPASSSSPRWLAVHYQIENLEDLIAAVKEHDAELGLAFDGDGDRLGVVSKRGEVVVHGL